MDLRYLNFPIIIRWYVCLLSCFSCARLCGTLWTIAHRVPLSMGFSKQEYWGGLPWPPPGDLPNPGLESMSPASHVDFFTAEPWGKAPVGVGGGNTLGNHSYLHKLITEKKIWDNCFPFVNVIPLYITSLTAFPNTPDLSILLVIVVHG